MQPDPEKKFFDPDDYRVVARLGGLRMPYIKKDKRPEIDKIVQTMADLGIKADGDLNYLLYAFCIRHVKPSYNNYKNFCGELRQCATEVERRLLGPYEDGKKMENGDVE